MKKFNNTELIKILKYQVKNGYSDKDLLNVIGTIIGSYNFTYKQLHQIRDIIKKSNLRRDMYLLFNELMSDLVQYDVNTVVDNYTEHYYIYEQ